MSSESKSEQDEAIEYVLIIFLVAALVGSVMRWMFTYIPAKRRPPYTVAVFLMGAGLAAIFTIDKGTHFGALGSAFYSTSKSLPPAIVLLVLLPILVYESAASLDYHIFSSVAPQCLMLAFPGVFIQVAITTPVIKYSFDIAWAVALVLSSILAATDPVSVVAALRDLGAPAKLSSLIEGESLLNDGSAFVLFLIAQEYALGESPSAPDLIGFFAQLALGGPVIGYVTALLAYVWILVTVGDPIVETIIVLIGYMGTNFLGESLHVSAVLAVVVFGLFMAQRGNFALSPDTEEKNETLIQVLSYLANTIVFFLAGIVVKGQIASTSVTDVYENGSNWALLLMVYVLLHVARFLMLLCLWPMLSRWGYGITWKEGVVMMYSGLRGAVGLALALSFAGESDISQEDRDLVLFVVSGIVLLTLVINGITTDILYNALHVYPANTYRQPLIQRTLETLETELQSKILKEIKQDFLYRRADWDCALSLLPKFSHAQIDQLTGKLYFSKKTHSDFLTVFRHHFENPQDHNLELSEMQEEYAEIIDAQAEMEQIYEHDENVAQPSYTGLDRAVTLSKDAITRLQSTQTTHVDPLQVLQVVQSIFLVVKAQYHRQYMHNELHVEALTRLQEAASRGEEYWKITSPDHYAYAFQREFSSLITELPFFHQNIVQIEQYIQTPVLKYIVQYKIYRWMFTALEALSGFLRAHEYARKASSLEFPSLHSGSIFIKFIERAERHVVYLESIYPHIATVTKTILAARAVLVAKQNALEELLHDGKLDKSDYSILHQILSVQLRQLLTSSYNPWLANLCFQDLQLTHHVIGERRRTALNPCKEGDCDQSKKLSGNLPVLGLSDDAVLEQAVVEMTLQKEKNK